MTDTNMADSKDKKVYDEPINFDVFTFKKLRESNSSKDVVELNQLVTKIAENEQLDAFKYLLEQGYKIDILNEKRQTALHLLFYTAAQTINCKINNRLLYNSIGDINYTDSQGLSLLHIASYLGIVDKVQDFLENNEDKNAIFHYKSSTNAKTRFTPLHLAALNHQLSTVNLLLKYGANVCPRNDQSVTPLHLAAGNYVYSFHPNCNDHRNVDLDILKTLIHHQSNLNAQDEYGNTPLMSVYSQCFFGQYGQFEEENEDSEIESQTVIETKRMKIGDLQKQKLIIFLKHGADVTLSNNNDDTILHLVINDLQSLRCASEFEEISFDDHNHVKMVKMILHKNAKIDINARNNLGATPLQLAVSYMSADIIKILLHNGASLEKVKLDFEVTNCFWHHYEHPNFESVKNLMSVVDTLEGAGFLLAPRDKLAILRFLVHDTHDCNCWVNKPLSDSKVNNFLYNGSLKHIKFVLTKAEKNNGIRRDENILRVYVICNATMMYKNFYTEQGFGKMLDFIKKIVGSDYLINVSKKLFKSEVFDNEIVQMKSFKLQGNVNLYDILRRDPNDIYQYICDVDYSLFKQFGFLEIFIKGHLTKATVRHYVKNLAECFVVNFLYPDLPDTCRDGILKYLNNEDIFNLCLAAKGEENNEDN